MGFNFASHAESFLGEIARGWDDPDAAANVQVICFEDAPEVGVSTFVTLGLSKHVLQLRSDKTVRHELVMPVAHGVSSALPVQLLLSLAEFVLESHVALLRGQVVPLPNAAQRELGFIAVYCASPSFVADAFATCRESNPATVVVWTIPIYYSEVAFIREIGWSAFEDILEQTNEDLFAWDRSSVV